MILILFLIIFFSYSILDENNKPKLPKINILEDDLNLKLNMKSDIIPDNPNIELVEAQIDEIKKKAKNFIPEPVSDSDIIIIKTSHGTMKLKFYKDKAPNHSLNFKKLANSGFYDKTIFHRVIPGFMIQGGDILSRDNIPENDGTGNPGWTINQEFNDIEHKRGILSMARSQNVNSAGSQFFICVDNAHHLDYKYTAFGELIEGHAVLDIITKLPSEAKQIFKSLKKEVPEDEVDENWMEYLYGNSMYYVKVPKTTTPDALKYEISRKLKNKHRTFIPVIINSIRVINQNNINE
tara:strand:- start:181 stop:1062 length:882 start_codon:yes stop_codon:yes gene_type:complete